MHEPIDELPGWAREMLEGCRVGRLGLLDESDAPRVLPVTYALHGGSVWTAIDRKPKRAEPARLRYLRRRPEVAFTVDRYEDDWEALAWVQILGTATLLEAAEQPAALAALAERYEPYRGNPPPGPLIRIAPDRALSWCASAGGS